jgi:hypothetical protein
MPRSQRSGTCAADERQQLREAERPIAAHARVRRLAAGEGADEGADDGAAELLAQVEGEVRQPERMARLARGDDGLGRAAGALGVRSDRIEPEPERHADRLRPGAEEGDGAVDAAAHRDRHPPGRRRGAEDGPDRVRERVDGQRLAADRRRLEEREARERAFEPRRVRLDDPLAVDGEPDERELAVPRGVSEELDHAVRLAAVRESAPPCRTLAPR